MKLFLIVVFLFFVLVIPPSIFSETDNDIIIQNGAHEINCELNNSCLDNPSLKINTGDTITWKNSDTNIHSIKSGSPKTGPDGIFESGVLQPNSEFHHTFEDPGNFDYFCTIHPWIVGTISVPNVIESSSFLIFYLITSIGVLAIVSTIALFYHKNRKKDNKEQQNLSSSPEIMSAETKKALVVGVSNYNSHLEDLDFCKKDAYAMNELLQSLGYDVGKNGNALIGNVDGQRLKDAIIDFFYDDMIKSTDTLLFYFSGHAVQDIDDTYFASTDIDPDVPQRRGFSFSELRRAMENSLSRRIVVILDCCYSGSAVLSKSSGDATLLGHKTILNSLKRTPQGEGKCLLLSSQDYQKSYLLNKEGHSVYTYYLLKGLSGIRESVDKHGNVTPQTLGNYVYDQVTNVAPKQKPLIKTEISGDIVLARYKHLSSTGQ